MTAAPSRGRACVWVTSAVVLSPGQLAPSGHENVCGLDPVLVGMNSLQK